MLSLARNPSVRAPCGRQPLRSTKSKFRAQSYQARRARTHHSRTLALGVSAEASRAVADLLDTHKAEVAALREATAGVVDPAKGQDDTWLLRFVLAYPEDTAEATSAVKETIAWRAGEGKPIVDAAVQAVQEAMAAGTKKSRGWDNSPIVTNAPHSSIISKYIGPSQILTITRTNASQDLVYCIRAARINDAELMQELTVEQLCDFFKYAKEVQSIVCEATTRATGHLTQVVTANDLNGISLFSGGAEFRAALSEASKATVRYYPQLAGPTVLLNLPALVRAIVGLFKPIFPKAVRDKLKFEYGPLLDVADLQDFLAPDSAPRTAFLAQLDEIL